MPNKIDTLLFLSMLDCMDPPLITVGMAGDIMMSGMVATPPYTAGTVVTYTCQPGWRLVGMDMSVCQGAPTFDWTLIGSDIPICVRGEYALYDSRCGFNDFVLDVFCSDVFCFRRILF